MHGTNVKNKILVIYSDQQIRNIYINNILQIASTATCFGASSSSSGNLNVVLY